jgi:hypothetical protein
MSLADTIEKLRPLEPGNETQEFLGKVDQLKALEQTEAVLKSVGINLESKFDISLAARIGMVIP